MNVTNKSYLESTRMDRLMTSRRGTASQLVIAVSLVLLAAPVTAADQPQRTRRVLYNFDGDSCLSTKAGGKGPVPVNVDDVKRLIDEVAYEGLPQRNSGLSRPEVEYLVFQFPADKIPRIDGDASDWSIVPEAYAIGQDQLRETVIGIGDKQDPTNLDVKVKVGWVKGQNHLYFLYEANDNYWDFAREDLHNDIFEVVIDGDLSGGPLIRQMHPQQKLRDKLETHFQYHGVHAQNYHIFTPAEGKDWAMVWGSQPWIKDLPYANAAYKYNFMHGDSGKLVLEFFITPFDHAPPDPARSVQTQLTEDKIIGMSWAILDYDDEKAESYAGFWNLSHKTTMYGDASDLVAFRLMPIEESLRKPVEADWSFQVVSLDDRVVAFRDRSFGDITAWHWDFGDGTSSTERHPTHHYEKPGEFIVTLKVEGPAGKARRAKVWDVTLP